MNEQTHPETTTHTTNEKIEAIKAKLNAARSSATNDRLNEVIDSVLLLMDL